MFVCLESLVNSEKIGSVQRLGAAFSGVPSLVPSRVKAKVEPESLVGHRGAGEQPLELPRWNPALSLFFSLALMLIRS